MYFEGRLSNYLTYVLNNIPVPLPNSYKLVYVPCIHVQEPSTYIHINFELTLLDQLPRFSWDYYYLPETYCILQRIGYLIQLLHVLPNFLQQQLHCMEHLHLREKRFALSKIICKSTSHMDLPRSVATMIMLSPSTFKTSAPSVTLTTVMM